MGRLLDHVGRTISTTRRDRVSRGAGGGRQAKFVSTRTLASGSLTVGWNGFA
jgi:hypothetical protein